MKTKLTNKFTVLRIFGALMAAQLPTVAGERVEWPVASGGNGHFYQAFLVSTGITWQAAWDAATAMGGYLATPTDAAENDFVFSLVSGDDAFWFLRPNTANGIGPWLGGFQAAGAAEPGGGWHWVTGEAFGYANWGPGQPDNGGSADRLHFAGFGTPKDKTCNDYPGTPSASWPSPRGYIVEWSPASPPTTPVQWTVASGGNGHFYQAFLVPTGITWQAASDAATSLGGYLATATNATENDFIYSLVSGDNSFWFVNINGNGVGPWLGGLQSDGALEPAGGWHWITGEPFTFTIWGTGQPDNGLGGQNRLHFASFPALKDKTWNDYADAPTALQPSPSGFIVEWSSAPPPTLAAFTAVELCLATMPNTQYQIQWTSSLPSTNWTNLGPPIAGDGTTKCLFDSTRGSTKRFYQVLVLP
ncbi:MAG: hypothetical protein HZA90_00375 [Verrucomicrobia bacterium]|nr:hypothetical protein [Verrucomicrobiota bacterium]